MQERDVNDLKNYYRTFSRVSERLTLMHLLSKTEQSRLFFFGLLVGIRNKTIKHYIRTLVKEHTELASVLESVKKALIVVPFTRELRFTSKKKEIDKFDSKTATKPLLNIPLKMLEVRSASEEEFKLLLSATDYKDEEEEEVKDTGARCKIIASTRIPKTQFKLFINIGMSYKGCFGRDQRRRKRQSQEAFLAFERIQAHWIKKNVRQQKEKNYGTFRAYAFQESGTAVKIDSKDRLFDSLIKKESSGSFRLIKADEAIEDVEREVKIT
ncbi:hypothetical protein MBM_03826 [Drepanopeziza brunnea f. sp. 'multigermtubi' MB_m1]|uniref:Uncharacterized protein n=1 Tax=Marssonina brunnea f. sp. multigermtubi (strain MB_m1) TaxID=1072389 RepID=K1XYZ4_MARBU|nr:uncharacterized protein MBM_03826 [Drepanopeziza brunnea f. sp. 'multigermtubi' MB_m1]EKD18054.1 hypothetical protein MBM_03826 [Drepanopeziza brunnea f. sp. 'multigermtubi' MB_m1]